MHTNIQAINYAVGANPTAVAIKDLNKDGHLDMVIANHGAHTISVLLGNHAGTFSPAPNSPYTVSTGPRSVGIEDLNKDGYLDIVVANQNANSVSVLLGNAAGTFAPSPNSPYSVGARPHSVAIGDLNKDGYLDVATANFDDHTVSVLFGDPARTFSQSTSYSVGTNPHSIAVGDLNKDGYLDITTANHGANSVSVLFGNSAGTFSPAPNSTYAICTHPYTVALGDLNEDGYLDIVAAGYSVNSVSILLGSPGMFSKSTSSTHSVGKNPLLVAIADLNKDGYLDIVTANDGDHSVSVLLGNSAGTFFPSTNSPYHVGKRPFFVEIADLNNDGNLDIVTANHDSNSVSVLYGTIDGPFSQSMGKFISQELGQAMHKITYLEQELVMKDQKLDQAMHNITHLRRAMENLVQTTEAKLQERMEAAIKPFEEAKSCSGLNNLEAQLNQIIWYPVILIGSLVAGVNLGEHMFNRAAVGGATIGALFGTAACLLHGYANITDYTTKLNSIIDYATKPIGDAKPEDAKPDEF